MPVCPLAMNDFTWWATKIQSERSMVSGSVGRILHTFSVQSSNPAFSFGLQCFCVGAFFISRHQNKVLLTQTQIGVN